MQQTHQEMSTKMVKGDLDTGTCATAMNTINRGRSNTWSVGCQKLTSEGREELEGVSLTSVSSSSAEADSSEGLLAAPQGVKESVTNFRKNWTRRNAWGNLSYAELITKAIESSPEKRLTLSQIYDWIVHNVEYFANKGDNSSSAGWKNSIRHNLSLHSRFVRLVNDGAGKSSWWSINPDAQPLKPSRRRAATLDSKSMNKKRSDATCIGYQKQLEFTGRCLEEVDSTTSGPMFSSSVLSPANGNPEEVTAMDGRHKVNPVRYPDENGLPKSMVHSNDVVGQSTNESPLFGLGFMASQLEVFKGEGLETTTGCYPENLSKPVSRKTASHPNGGRILGKRRFVPEDRCIGEGFFTGNGIYYKNGFDSQHSSPGNSFYPVEPKRYFDEGGCYGQGVSPYGGCHDSSYYPRCGQTNSYGYYGNGVSYDNRRYPDGGSAEENQGGTIERGGGARNDGTGNSQRICAGGYPEERNDGPNRQGSRSKDGSVGSDENRDIMSFQGSRFCTYNYDTSKAGAFDVVPDNYRSRDDSDHGYRNEALRIPPVSRIQGESKSEASLGSVNFFTALTTTSSYAPDYPANPGDLRPISPNLTSLAESYYRPGDKYSFLPDLLAKPFSQLLANRATYTTCRNGNANDDFYIPTTF